VSKEIGPVFQFDLNTSAWLGVRRSIRRRNTMVPPTVSYGVHLPSRTLSGGDPLPASHSLLIGTVEAAKSAGFSGIWVTDHIVYWDPWMDCMSLLAAVAGRAGELGLSIATGVVGLPLRHPVAMAQSFATLDILSGGNLIIGVGEGSTQSDFDALGIPFEERRKMLADGVAALRALLSKTGVTHRGPYYTFENVTISPGSVQKPCPPIWLSSWGSPGGMRRVARLGDGWVASALHSTPEEFHVAFESLNVPLLERGKDPDTFPNAVDTMFMFIDEDGKKARRLAAPIIEAAARAPFDAGSGHYLVGDYEECKALLARWIEAGAKQVCLWPVADATEQIRRFGAHVMPDR
jgi:alkanesulfonate monooxygenase SsuD/methylene tetrahydromethanopterin reductase-like flavin-dependent oxidoreductase (luciferase family)